MESSTPLLPTHSHHVVDNETNDQFDPEIPLKDGGIMLLEQTCVNIGGPTAARLTKASCRFYAVRRDQLGSIPLRNILWAERVGDKITIDFALSATKHQLRASSITVVPNSSDPHHIDIWIESMMDRAYGLAKRQKRATVLINPHSGQGDALKVWKQVEPLFRAARLSLNVTVTKCAGEALLIARSANIEGFDTFIACSGDGLPYEIFNGLGERPDARTSLRKIAVSQIPCATGNAMACNLYGSNYPTIAALGIIKGVDTAIDLASVTQGDNRKLSFLSQSYGMLAEVDIDTENLRWMGALRFQLGVLKMILKKKAYPCDIDLKVELDDKAAIRAAFQNFSVSDTPNGEHLAGGSTVAVKTLPDGDYNHLQGLPPLKYGTPDDNLPEDGWTKINYDNLGSLYCGKMTYAAAHTNFFPASLPNDGFLDLITVNCDLPLQSLLELWSKVGDKSTLYDDPNVKYYKVAAFRITPRDQKGGFISIDGEAFPFGPIQVEVHPGLGKVYTLQGKYEAPGL